MKASMLAVLLGLGLAACGNDGSLKVTGIEPQTGDIEGGQTVAIHGQGFRTVTRNVKVYFGGAAGTVTRIGNDEIIVQAPGGKLGPVDVLVVFEPGGEHPYKNGFTFVQKEDVNVKDLGGKKP